MSLGLGVVESGVESIVKSPEEAPIPSALNAPPILRGIEVCKLSGFMIMPQCGVLYNPHPPFTTGVITNPNFDFAAARRFLTRTWSYQHLTAGGDYSGTRTDSQDGNSFYPSASVSAGQFFSAFNKDPDVFLPNKNGFNSPANNIITNGDPAYMDVQIRTQEQVRVYLLDAPGGSHEQFYEDSVGSEFFAKPQIDAMLSFLAGQNLAGVWTVPTTLSGQYHGWRRCFNGPSLTFPSTAPFIGGLGSFLGNSSIAGINTTLDLYSAPYYNGETYAPVYPNPNATIGIASAGVPYEAGAVINSSIYPCFVERAQIRAQQVTPYTVYERLVHSRIQSVAVYRRLYTGIAVPGQVLELPSPSRTDFPFISNGFCATGIKVGFLPDETLESFVTRTTAPFGITGIVVSGF